MAEPTSVAEFLALHELEGYAEAFKEEGWDSLRQLRGIEEPDLLQLIKDVKMKSGHIRRLRTALGKAVPAADAVEKPAAAVEAAVPPPPGAVPAASPAAAETGPVLTGTAAQCYAKLIETVPVIGARSSVVV